MAASEGSYNIKAVSSLTGLPTDTLRAWERRYAVVQPERGETGRRLYSKDDVARLRLLAEAVHRGHAIGTIAKLGDVALRSLIAEPTATDRVPVLGLDTVMQTVLDAIDEYDADRCERTLAIALSAIPVESVTDDLLMPLLIETGERWHRGEFTVAQERLVSATIRRLALNLLTMLSVAAREPRLLLGTLPGEDHELGALLAAVNAAALGVPCDYVGADLPGAEFARIATERGVSAVAISIVQNPASPETTAELAALEAGLPTSIEIWVGGAGAAGLHDAIARRGVVHLASMADFRRRAMLLIP